MDKFEDARDFAEQETGKEIRLYSKWLLFTHLTSLLHH
jgi:hypothetical protein